MQCNCALKVVNRGLPIDFVQSISVEKCINVMNVWIALTGLVNGGAGTSMSFFFKILFTKHWKLFLVRARYVSSYGTEI